MEEEWWSLVMDLAVPAVVANWGVNINKKEGAAGQAATARTAPLAVVALIG